jgi:hypothetical protein
MILLTQNYVFYNIKKNNFFELECEVLSDGKARPVSRRISDGWIYFPTLTEDLLIPKRGKFLEHFNF